MKRVVITGIGLITPLGIGTEVNWTGIVEGRSGIGRIKLFDASSLQTQIAGEVPGFSPQEFIANRRILRTMTRGDQLAFTGATLAIRDSEIDVTKLDNDRVGLFIGGNKEVCDPKHLMEPTLDARDPNGTMDMQRFFDSAESTAYPLFFVEGLPAASLFHISEAYGFKGANGFFVGTADASAVAIGTAYRAIRRGEVDMAVTGGFDDAVSWWSMTKLEALQVMSDRNELGAAAYRPYDRDRSGTIIGEGAAFLVMEEYQAAVKRNARMYAEVSGFGNGCDAHSVIAPHPQGRGLVRALEAALQESGMSTASVDYVATHGSGTRAGDPSEVRAIREVFGKKADYLPASSIKPSTGHLVAAAGSLNAAVTALALHEQVLPPMLNLRDPDPACRLHWVTGQRQKARIKQAIALARGLEGQNVALAMRRV